jgi:hypothetical protein
MYFIVRLVSASTSSPRAYARVAWAALLGGLLTACGPDEGKDDSASGGTSTTATGGSGGAAAGGTSGTGSTGAGGSSTGGSGTVVDDPNFTLGEPQTLASGQPVPIRLVLIGDNVYFANRGLDDQPTGAIMRVPKNGGSVSAFASAIAYVSGLASNGVDTLVYTTYGLTTANPRQGSIVIHPIGGTAQTTSPVQYPYEPAWSDNAIYFFQLNTLIRAQLGGESSTLATLTSPHRRWHDGGRIYITDGPHDDQFAGQLRVWSETEPDAPVLNDALARPEGLVMAKGRLYVACPGDGTVVSIDPTSGAAQTVASGYVAPWGVASDSANVYFADRGAIEDCVAGDKRGAIVRVPLDGGAAEKIASDLQCPSTIAVDATGIYWIDNGTIASASDGSVMKIAKIR